MFNKSCDNRIIIRFKNPGSFLYEIQCSDNRGYIGKIQEPGNVVVVKSMLRKNYHYKLNLPHTDTKHKLVSF